jgi:hypothetical protein
MFCPGGPHEGLLLGTAQYLHHLPFSGTDRQLLLVIALRRILDGLTGFFELISSPLRRVVDTLAGLLRRALFLTTGEYYKQCTYQQGCFDDLDWSHDSYLLLNDLNGNESNHAGHSHDGIRTLSDCNAPACQGGHIADRSSFVIVLVDLVTDDATNGGTADGSDRAAAGKNGPAHGADTGADSGVFVLCRHSGTPPQTEQHCCGNCTERVFLYRFHGITFS